MNDDDASGARAWRGLGAIALAALVVDVLGIAAHSGFQPVYTLRTAAPAIGLVLGATFTHRVAARRARVDAAREFDPRGRSLFLGFVMVAATVIAWLLAAQALPSLLNAASGTARSEVAVVAEKPAATGDADCGHRLVVTSASLARPLDECVDEALWRAAGVGSKVTVDLVASAFGAEARALRP